MLGFLLRGELHGEDGRHLVVFKSETLLFFNCYPETLKSVLTIYDPKL